MFTVFAFFYATLSDMTDNTVQRMSAANLLLFYAQEMAGFQII